MCNKTYISTFFISLLLFSSCKEVSKLTDHSEIFVDSLISIMTLEEKIGQLTLYTSDWDITGPAMRQNYIEDIRKGKCGNIFNAHTVAYNKKLQKIAVEETRLGIPLLFGYDVIHGHKTIFPIPLAEACSWDPEMIKESCRLAAKEATASGLNWTFAPMVDISRDPRWGRVSEGSGEDAYLGSLISKAKVEGFQGTDLADPSTMASCIKHFAAYGAPVAGRDYNTVDMSELAFYQDYLPPYKAGIEAGAVTVMASFNELFGVPATASKYLMTDILRKSWGFKGFVVTDYIGVEQLIPHGVAGDKKQAGELAINAGIDMDMQSAIYSDFLSKSLEEGKVSISVIDESVRRILLVKYNLGLFKNPFLYLDEQRESEVIFSEEIMQHALESARKSIVLLKNDVFKDKPVLPLSKSIKRIAVVGPLGENQLDLLGSWHAAGDVSKVVTICTGLRNKFPEAKVEFSPGCDFYSNDKSGFAKAISLANNSDAVIVTIGEQEGRSGEAASRSEISIPGIQEELALELLKTGKPVVIVILAERPLVFSGLSEKATSILYAWHPGTRSGDAIADILSGDYNPSAKLVISFPRNVGQIPVYYNYKNTGRPFEPNNKYTSQYLDISNDPLYPFGFGLSYTRFEYGKIVLDKSSISGTETLSISVNIRNTGIYPGNEIVQLYIRDLVGSITRPVKELKGFQIVYIKPGEMKNVIFTISEKDLRFYNADLHYVSEPGQFKVFIGTNSRDTENADFELI